MSQKLTEEEVLTTIREEMARIKIEGAEQATMETDWRDLDVDSLALVELVTAIEDRFGIKIGDGELKEIAGVGDAVRITLRLANEGAAA
jgi:acyl carrier protein